MPKHRVTIEDLLSLKQPSDVAVAPDGAQVAFCVRTVDFEKSRYTYQIHLAERSARSEWKTRQVTFGDASSTYPQWSPDGSYLAFQSSRKTNNNGEAKAQVFALDLRGGEARQVTKAHNGVLRWRWATAPQTKSTQRAKDPKNGLAIVFTMTAEKPTAEETVRENERKRKFDQRRVHRDIPNREFWLSRGPFGQPLEGTAKKLSDGDPGVGAFDVSRDGKRIVFTTNLSGIRADSDKFDLYVLDLGTGKHRQLTKRKGSEHAPQFSPDGKWVSFFAPFDESVHYSRNDLWALPSGGGALRNLSQAFDREVAEAAWSDDSKSLIAICEYGTFSRLVRFGLEGRARILHEVDEVLGDLDVARDGKTLAVIAQGPTQAPEVWVCSSAIHRALRGTRHGGRAMNRATTNRASAKQVTDLNPQTKKWQLPKLLRVRWKNEGLEHEGILFTPATAKGDLPLIVMIHGGPHSHLASTMTMYNNPVWCAEGYACFIPNYRGSSGYSNMYGIANRGDLGGGDYRDLMSGVDKVLSRGKVDASRLCVTGGSYGGYLTNWIIGHTDRFKAAVSLFGIFSLFTDFSNSENPNWDPAYLTKFWWEDWDKYHDHSPAKFVTEMKTPVLILHGDEDNNTFIANSHEMYQALRLLDRTVEFVRYPREGHGFREPNHQRDAFRRTLAWFDQYGRSGGDERERVWRVGDKVAANGRELRIVSAEVVGDYAGVKAKGQWLEVVCVVKPNARHRELVLHTADFSLFVGRASLAPQGVAVTALGEKVLARGDARFAVANDDPQKKRALACALVFDAPKTGGSARLLVADFAPVQLWIPTASGTASGPASGGK